VTCGCPHDRRPESNDSHGDEHLALNGVRARPGSGEHHRQRKADAQGDLTQSDRTTPRRFEERQLDAIRIANSCSVREGGLEPHFLRNQILSLEEPSLIRSEDAQL
jgi:hypothetical protein